jgi:hypothetical protein
MNQEELITILWAERFSGEIPEGFLDKILAYGLNTCEFLYIFNVVHGFHKEDPMDVARILASMVKKTARNRSKNFITTPRTQNAID